MSKAVYYKFVVGKTVYINVYADENAQAGGYVNLTGKKDTSRWNLAGHNGSVTQDALRQREVGVATLIRQCQARKLLKDHGYTDVKMF